jgi:hypothetical protein
MKRRDTDQAAHRSAKFVAWIALGAVIATLAGAITRVYDDNRLDQRVSVVEHQLREEAEDRARETCIGQIRGREFLVTYFRREASQRQRLAEALEGVNDGAEVAAILRRQAGESAQAARQFGAPAPCADRFPGIMEEVAP